MNIGIYNQQKIKDNLLLEIPMNFEYLSETELWCLRVNIHIEHLCHSFIHRVLNVCILSYTTGALHSMLTQQILSNRKSKNLYRLCQFKKNRPFFNVYAVTARSATLCCLRMYYIVTEICVSGFQSVLFHLPSDTPYQCSGSHIIFV